MAQLLLETANFWAFQLKRSDKEVRQALVGREPDGMRGKSQEAWYLTTVLAALSGKDGGSELDPTQERARKDKEAADKLAMENAVRRGELADLNVVGRVRALELANFRARLRAAPSKLAPRVNPENPNLAADLIAAELDAILAELADADWTELIGGGEGVQGVEVDSPPPAAADGEPVGGREPDAVGRKQRRARKVEH